MTTAELVEKGLGKAEIEKAADAWVKKEEDKELSTARKIAISSVGRSAFVAGCNRGISMTMMTVLMSMIIGGDKKNQEEKKHE